jgi:hypothetical protein
MKYKIQDYEEEILSLNKQSKVIQTENYNLTLSMRSLNEQLHELKDVSAPKFSSLPL